MNFITLQGRNFNLNTVQEYKIEITERRGIFIKGEIILHFINGTETLTYHNEISFNHDKHLLLEEVH